MYKQCGNIMSADQRLALRIDESEKNRVISYSKKYKMTSSEFVKKAIEHYIRYLAVQESETITLTREEFSILRLLLEADAEPNARLTSAARAYKEFEQKRKTDRKST